MLVIPWYFTGDHYVVIALREARERETEKEEGRKRAKTYRDDMLDASALVNEELERVIALLAGPLPPVDDPLEHHGEPRARPHPHQVARGREPGEDDLGGGPARLEALEQRQRVPQQRRVRRDVVRAHRAHRQLVHHAVHAVEGVRDLPFRFRVGFGRGCGRGCGGGQFLVGCQGVPRQDVQVLHEVLPLDHPQQALVEEWHETFHVALDWLAREELGEAAFFVNKRKVGNVIFCVARSFHGG